MSLEIPKGFKDVTYHHDECKSYYNEDLKVTLYVNDIYQLQEGDAEMLEFASLTDLNMYLHDLAN